MDALLNELRDEIYDDAVKHGLWDEDYLLKISVPNGDAPRRAEESHTDAGRTESLYWFFMERKQIQPI